MKDTGGPDHIIVRVKLPSGAIQTPVSKNDLYTSPPGKTILYVTIVYQNIIVGKLNRGHCVIFLFEFM